MLLAGKQTTGYSVTHSLCARVPTSVLKDPSIADTVKRITPAVAMLILLITCSVHYATIIIVRMHTLKVGDGGFKPASRSSAEDPPGSEMGPITESVTRPQVLVRDDP